MSKYIYINSLPVSTPNGNTIVGLVPVDEVADFETEFTGEPLMLQFGLIEFGGNASSLQNYNISITNKMTAADAKLMLDRAVIKTLIEAHVSLEAVVNFYPPSGISLSSLG